jgi:hypothetical protein
MHSICYSFFVPEIPFSIPQMIARLHFFALRSDLLLILNSIEAKKPLKYVLAAVSSTPDIQEWAHARELPGLGQADREQTLGCRPFLLTYAEIPVKTWRSEQLNGKIRFDIDQRLNPDSIRLIPAGEWKGQMIIAGIFDTLSKYPSPQSLMRAAASAAKKHFTKVRAYWVGPEALVQLRSGRRLTGAEQSPPMYDLREES